ncbi:hypothetical protein P4V86_00380 [Brevibacillus laterosporus]|uniref:hypothetical protein n=1 Tax=Brevibacillus laterosporus TaxID=1465 RepID=UPI000379CD1D|nr:hypothetical protein [Brevibacillus laterosporus]ATO48918.1 hypothetical protein BrL25_07270 [Brevibacillus laterosporus DSM 25]MBG9803236.1 hypothetical protein [Brevibacillus laterosporus]MED2001820.1 hypothetical protein [Brevibacillus laterosporus]MED4764104.1 hypothetical protein [Brevibacillus laterosporus]TPH09126.1 hypothetical protein EGH09_22010 [Brevibacillus laterosporus]
MKKFCVPLLSMALFASVIGFTPDYASAKKVTSVNVSEDNQDKVDKRFTEIAEKYEIGEAIKGDDLEFIKKYSVIVEDNDEMKAKAVWDIEKVFKITGSASNEDLSAKLSGELTAVVGFWHNTVDGDLKLAVTKGSPKKYRLKANLLGFGLVNSDGDVGKTVDKTFDSDWNESTKKSYPYTFGGDIYANIIYYNVSVDGSVKSSNGTLTVRGKEDKD